MKKRITINNKLYYITQYNTKNELELLEFIELNNDLTYDDYHDCAFEFFKRLGIHADNLSDYEIIILLLKIREFTIGTEVKLNIKCPICSKQFATTIDTSNVYTNAIKDNTFDADNFVSKEYIDNAGEEVIPEDTDWDLYEDLIKNLKDYYNIYNLDFKIKCPHCNAAITFSIDSIQKALSFISEESLQSLMNTIHSLTYHDKLSRSDVLMMTPLERLIDVLMMTPLERLIELSLLKKSLEALTESQKS